MLMVNKNKKLSRKDIEQGFITMIVMMIIIVAAVIYLAYKRVSNT
jgi:hypothetical protein